MKIQCFSGTAYTGVKSVVHIKGAKMRTFRIGIKLLSLLLAAALVFGNLHFAVADEPADQAVVTENEESNDADLSLTPQPEEMEDPVVLAEDEAADPSGPAPEGSDQTEDPVPAEGTGNEEEGSDETDPKELFPPEDERQEETQESADPEGEAGENEPVQEDQNSEETEQEDMKPSVAGPVLKGSFNSDKTVYTLTLSEVSITDPDYFEASVSSTQSGADAVKKIKLTAKDSSYSAKITLSELGRPGDYKAAVYKITDSGSELIEEIGFTVPSAMEGTLSITSLNKTAGTAVINVNGLTSETGFKSVSAKVWNKSDKSDLYTYTMTDAGSGKWTADMDIAKHKKVKGLYNIEVVSVDGNGFEQTSAKGSVDFNGATGKIGIVKGPAYGSYKVKLTGFSCSYKVKGVRAVLWSEKNGQDDKLTHKMEASSSGTTYSFLSHIDDFKNLGKIVVRIYIDKADGGSAYYAQKKFTIDPPAGKITAKITANKGIISVKLADVSSEYAIDSIKVRVWRKTDKSDAKWYLMQKDSDTAYSRNNISIRDFKSYSGTYHAEAYAYMKRGPKLKMAGTTLKISDYAGAASYFDNNAGKTGQEQKEYTVRVRGIAQKAGVSKVQFRIWSLKNTSLKKWYTASYSNGFYKVKVPIRDFKLGGQYRAKVYVTDTAGKRTAVKTKDIMNVNGYLGGKIRIFKAYPETGKFTIGIKDTISPSGLDSVRFTVWTKSNKSDKHTFTAKKYSDGSYRAVVNISKLKYNTGTFHVIANTVMGNGIKKNSKQKDVTFNVSSNFIYVTKPKTGKRTLGIINPSPSSDLRFAVWSEKNGQDDLRWTSGTLSGKKCTVTIDLLNYKDPGKFLVDVYSGNTFLGSTTFQAETGEVGRTGWFYENGYKFYYKAGKKLTDLTGMVSGPYKISVNRLCNVITIYAIDGGNGYIIPVIAFTCSTGLPGMETPLGDYYTYAKNRWEELMGPSWGQYSARVVDGIYIHSMPSGIPNSHYGIDPNEYNKLGSPASHGCIRVNVHDAKWIYDHCGVGTWVHIYDSTNPGPYGKPATIKLSPGQNWDPTDPAL